MRFASVTHSSGWHSFVEMQYAFHTLFNLRMIWRYFCLRCSSSCLHAVLTFRIRTELCVVLLFVGLKHPGFKDLWKFIILYFYQNQDKPGYTQTVIIHKFFYICHKIVHSDISQLLEVFPSIFSNVMLP